jgi:rubrerythrin
MARTAEDEGFDDIAEWFRTLAKAGRSHLQRLWQTVDRPDFDGSVFADPAS